MEADIIIKGGMVLTLDENQSLYKAADLVIKDSTIIEISPQTKYSAKKIIPAIGKLVMPGLINVHSHAAMVMMRGLADDMPLDIWWQKFIFPIEKKMVDSEFIRIGVSLAAIEMIRSGTTTFSDMYFFQMTAAEVCKKIGIRALLGEAILDFPSPDASETETVFKLTEQLFERWQGDPIISLTVAPHAPYTCNRANMVKARKQADKLGLPLHVHVAETAEEIVNLKNKEGLSPVEYLDSFGFLDERVIAVHCVHLNQRDMEIFKKRGVKVAHCQESNMKLASGGAPIVELSMLGVLVGLGTDGAASNNNLDMFDEMDSVAKYHKAIRSDPTVMPAPKVVQMATREGARVLLRPDIGSLSVGKKADVILLDLQRPHLVPLYNIYSHLVYSAGGSEVETVIIDGKIVMENRRILTIDEAEIIDQANHLAKKISREVLHV